MKVIQLSDSHLALPGRQLHGSLPLERLRYLLAHATDHHGDACCIIISGDLTHRGETEAYLELRTLLAGQCLPVHLMLGNHDRRTAFRQVFPEYGDGAEPFMQRVIIQDRYHLLLLDTLDEGSASGHLCERRLSWLSAQLQAAGDNPVYLFMHHPPFDVGMAPLDNCRLDNPDALHALLAGHANVRHLFCGHVHRYISGTWRGLPFSTVKGCNHQTALGLGALPHEHSGEAPGYGVILISDESTVVHYQDVPDL